MSYSPLFQGIPTKYPGEKKSKRSNGRHEYWSSYLMGLLARQNIAFKSVLNYEWDNDSKSLIENTGKQFKWFEIAIQCSKLHPFSQSFMNFKCPRKGHASLRSAQLPLGFSDFLKYGNFLRNDSFYRVMHELDYRLSKCDDWFGKHQVKRELSYASIFSISKAIN